MDREKNIFDGICSLIPGYRGYAEREGRRDCDKLLRVQISEILIDSENILRKRLGGKLVNNESLEQLEANRKQISTLFSQIKYSPYGTSSFFSASQLRENELDQIYQRDLVLIERAISLKKMVLNAVCSDIDEVIVVIKEAITIRNRFIEEFK